MSENYLDAISETELERLGMQHQAWKPETDSFLREAGFSSFKRIAEFGCGPGLTTRDIALEINPDAEVCAMDISDLYLQHLESHIVKAKISNIRTVKANLTVPVDFDSNFDGAFCRWFLAWIYRDLDTVLTNIYKSLKPGGVFASMEYLTLKSTVSSPPSRAFDRIVTAWEEFYLQCGGTTEVGSTLPAALARAGFEIKQVKCVGGLAPNGHRLFGWWKRLNQDFNKTFKEKNLLTDEQELELNKYWEQISLDPNSFIYTPVLVQTVAVKP